MGHIAFGVLEMDMGEGGGIGDAGPQGMIPRKTRRS